MAPKPVPKQPYSASRPDYSTAQLLPKPQAYTAPKQPQPAKRQVPKPNSAKQTYSADSPKPVFIKAPPAPGPVYLDPPNPVYAEPEVKKAPAPYKPRPKKQIYSATKSPVATLKKPTYKDQKQSYNPKQPT